MEIEGRPVGTRGGRCGSQVRDSNCSCRFTRDHHGPDSPARLGPVKALRSAPTPPLGGAHGLDGALSSHGPALT